ncbi:MAG: histidine kinase, partial [Acidobacteriota bacterium]|nr:histidine kinase [Acidobacteriota bacterium]
METGFVIPQHFWREYLSTLQIGMPLAIVFGLGAFAHGSLRERVHQLEQTLHEKEVAEERAGKLAIEARLRSLESHIHPHFLFNTLNSIMSLIVVNPVRAEKIVGQLASLLRSSLDNSIQPMIPFWRELAMVQSYIDIENLRLGDKFRGVVAVPSELQNAQVPPMSVQSLVEKLERSRSSNQVAQPEWKTLLKRISESLREASPEYLERIASRLGDRLWFLDVAQVTHFYAEDELTYAVSLGKAYSIDYA